MNQPATPFHPIKGRRMMINFRMPEELVALMDEASKRAGLNRTEWVIATVALALRREVAGLTMGAPTPHPKVIDGCAHPKPLRYRGPEGLVCRQCNSVLVTPNQGA